VWQDMVSGDAQKTAESKANYRKELTSMIGALQSHPSIVMWVPFNEGWGQHDTPEVVELVKELDPSRPVNEASGWTDKGSGDISDMHNYPGPNAPKLEEGRAGVLGEFGGLGFPVEHHVWQTNRNWGYRSYTNAAALTAAYIALLDKMHPLEGEAGLNAAVYTQTTDVEVEVNGFLTYDREVLKMDEARVREANLGKGPRMTVTAVVKTAREEPAEWKYTFEKPADGWEKADFDDSSWKTGKGGFGTEGTPGATIGTKWNSPDIWLRREIDLPADVNLDDVELLVHHDDEMQIFINGAAATASKHFTTDYVERRIKPEARNVLKAGKNLLAVHCHQLGGGQYIDVGFVKLTEVKPK